MFLKNYFTKLQIFLFLLTIIIPTNIFAYSKEVILGGSNIGIEVKANGVIVVGFYEVNGTFPGKESSLQIGDKIIKINDNNVTLISDLAKEINDDKTIDITYIRNNKEYNTSLTMYLDSDNVYKTGLLVKDSILGIGTLTFVDFNNNYKFAALGHEIIEKTTGSKFEISTGSIFKSDVTGIDKATRVEPGSKNANYFKDNYFGSIEKNEITGIFGTYEDRASLDVRKIKIAESNEINTGEATIRTVISGDTIEEFKINILKINSSSDTKNILFSVTDERLLNITGGIVQGMSGSPIIQNDKLIGAVTHVLSDDPTKGFGIFITSMLKEIE